MRFARLFAITAIAAAGAASICLAGAASPNDILPEAEAKSTIIRACTSCHEAPMIVAKRRTLDEWDETVGKMIARGAAVDYSEQDAVVDYLAKYFGPTPAPSEIPPSPSPQ